MPVRAKFKVTRVEIGMNSVARRDDGGNYVLENGRNVYDKVEMRTIVMHPVYDDRQGSENKKFWDASPSGELKLGTINPGAWRQFELDREYYLDFTPADAAGTGG